MSMVVVAVVIVVLAILCLFLGLYFCDLCDTSSQGNGRHIRDEVETALYHQQAHHAEIPLTIQHQVGHEPVLSGHVIQQQTAVSHIERHFEQEHLTIQISHESPETNQLKIFNYKELAKATDSFSNINHLGDGGCGQVFKGTLPDGQVVAIKKLAHESEQRERDQFIAEVETINRTCHQNVVKLIGYCNDEANRLIIYEYVPNTSLRYNLHGKNMKIIDWSTRFKIALGSAEGLAYLHEECNPRVIHRDIKTANILLDDNFEPKIADFGLAKDFSNSVTHISTDPKGTKGYVAPENLKGRKLTDKSDVFSFGVVLLELVTGKQAVEGNNAVELAVWVSFQLKEVLDCGRYDTLIDDKLREKYNKNEVTRMICCAAACVYKPAANRPKMSEIVGVLKGNMALECVWQSIDSEFLHDGAPYYSIV